MMDKMKEKRQLNEPLQKVVHDLKTLGIIAKALTEAVNALDLDVNQIVLNYMNSGRKKDKKK